MPEPIAMPQASLDWYDNLQNHYSAQRILRMHPELRVYFVIAEQKGELLWREVNSSSELQPFHFELYFGRDTQRAPYLHQAFAEVAETQKFTIKSFDGFYDIFHPVRVDPSRRTFLYVGQFCREPLDWSGVTERWRIISGREPASADPDFVRFVRMILDMPVIEEPVLERMSEFLELLADIYGGGAHASYEPGRMEELRREAFVRYFPDHGWVNQAISSDKFHLTPWFLEGKFADWMREEMHISRLPTSVLALMPLDTRGTALDPMQTMVRNYRIQYECMKRSIELPHTGANKLGDYGVLFLTSPNPKHGPARARADLREHARELQSFVWDRFKVRSAVGIGRTLPPGEPLYPSYHDAVLALHLCVQLDRDILFHDEQDDRREGRSFLALQEASVKLEEVFGRASIDEIKLAADRYVRLALVYSSERLEVVRGQFLAMLFQLARMLQRNYQVRPQVVGQFCEDITHRLEEAATIYQVIEKFNDALERLAFYSSRSLEGPKSMRLHTTLEYLKANFNQPLRVQSVARKAGFSVPAFSRIFRQATGTSFLAYVRKIRVEHAKMLLRTTDLSAAQIAEACGFQSQHHLIRSFKRVTSQTPGDYRKSVAGLKNSAS